MPFTCLLRRPPDRQPLLRNVRDHGAGSNTTYEPAGGLEAGTSYRLRDWERRPNRPASEVGAAQEDRALVRALGSSSDARGLRVSCSCRSCCSSPVFGYLLG